MKPLWLALCLPFLPIEIFLRGSEAALDGSAGPASSDGRTLPDGAAPPSGPASPNGIAPLAVCEHRHILLSSPSAQTLGVHPGIKRATALALAPALHLLERDPAREDRALRQVACWAGQFTPSVSLQPSSAATRGNTAGLAHGRPPAGVLLEIAPSLTLFGGLDALLSRIRSGLTELGFAARMACAPTPSGAWLLALHRDGLRACEEEQLDALLVSMPVLLLPNAQPHLPTLESIGVRTIGELMRLPRAGLARRFGKELLIDLDHAFGRQPEPRRWFQAPERFESSLELLAQVESAEALLFAARRLILELTGWLAARQAAVRRIDLLGEHDEGPPTGLSLRLSDATRDATRITSLLRERLSSASLRAAVHTLRLRCDEVVPLAGDNHALFPSPAQTREDLNRLIERLQARLGPEHVRKLLLVADHRPEIAWKTLAVDHDQPIGTARAHAGRTDEHTRPPVAGALPRPLWLLSRPIALSERNNRPYWHGPLTLLAGPERIESGWWDCRLIQRDYFIAADESDMLLWIYRERLPDADSRQGWFVQGKFG